MSSKNILLKINFITLVNFNLLVAMDNVQPKKYKRDVKTYCVEKLPDETILELTKNFKSSQQVQHILQNGNYHAYGRSCSYGDKSSTKKSNLETSE